MVIPVCTLTDQNSCPEVFEDLQLIQWFPDIVSAEPDVANGFRNHPEYFQTLIASYSIDMASFPHNL
jgi:hypothetical protein